MKLDFENYRNENVTSLGIGLTNRCNLNCSHCYSRGMAIDDMSLDGVKGIYRCFPNLKKVNFGTGESILCPQYDEIITFFKEKDIQMALTTNGLTIKRISDEEVSYFKDVDISLDYPIEDLHDKWRGVKGTFRFALDALERCEAKKVDVSIALALMNHNYKHLAAFRPILDQYKISLRLNVYKPTDFKHQFELSYDQFWDAMKILADNFKKVSISEPILSLVTETCSEGSPCGGSLRIHPNMYVTGCVYIDPQKYHVDEFIRQKSIFPKFCTDRNCEYLKKCHGGCLGRRYLQDGVASADRYCPFLHDSPIPKINFEKSNSQTDFVHAGYLCTLIVE